MRGPGFRNASIGVTAFKVKLHNGRSMPSILASWARDSALAEVKHALGAKAPDNSGSAN